MQPVKLMKKRFVRSLFSLLLFAGLGFSSMAQEVQPIGSVAELQQRLAAHVRQPKFAAATWGVKVVSLETGAILFEENPQLYFSPASNSKLYTVALVLDRLGAIIVSRPRFTAPTSQIAAGVERGPVNLWPRRSTFNRRLNSGDLFRAPIRSSTPRPMPASGASKEMWWGTKFFAPPFGSGWAWMTCRLHGAPISALTIVTTG